MQEVSESELEELRKQFIGGSYTLDVTTEEFDFGAHAAHCKSIESDVAAWRAQQAAASKKMAEEDAAILKKLEESGYKAGGGGGGEGMAAGGADGDKGVDLSQYAGAQYDKAAAPFAASVWEVSVAAGAHHTWVGAAQPGRSCVLMARCAQHVTEH